MRNQLKLFFFTVPALIFLNCSADKVVMGEEVVADCVQTQPTGAVPQDLYQADSVRSTDEFPPFTKKLTVCGITLIAREDVADLFMEKVAAAVSAMFAVHDHTDTLLQRELLSNLYRYKTAIPLFYGEDWSISSLEEQAWDQTSETNSICDIIMAGVPDPVMEVMEHILHHVTDVGLHYTFPQDWGLSNSSRLYTVTQEAIDMDYYAIEQYSDIDEPGVRNRVILQEYAYWIIYTAWDLREAYGPQESEWSIMNSNQLQDKLSGSYGLFEETIPQVLTCPGPEILNAFLD